MNFGRMPVARNSPDAPLASVRQAALKRKISCIGDDVAFHAGDLAEARRGGAAVAHALELKTT